MTYSNENISKNINENRSEDWFHIYKDELIFMKYVDIDSMIKDLQSSEIIYAMHNGGISDEKHSEMFNDDLLHYMKDHIAYYHDKYYATTDNKAVMIYDKPNDDKLFALFSDISQLTFLSSLDRNDFMSMTARLLVSFIDISISRFIEETDTDIEHNDLTQRYNDFLKFSDNIMSSRYLTPDKETFNLDLQLAMATK